MNPLNRGQTKNQGTRGQIPISSRSIPWDGNKIEVSKTPRNWGGIRVWN